MSAMWAAERAGCSLRSAAASASSWGWRRTGPAASCPGRARGGAQPPPAADDPRQRPDRRCGPTQPPPHPSGQRPQRGQGRTLSHAGQAIHQPAELDQQRAQPGHQHRRAHPEPAPPVPHGGVRHPKPRSHRTQPRPGRHPLQRRTDHPDHVHASKQRKRWQQRMRHTAPPAPGPDHPHPPDTAATVTQIPLIARPEHHRPVTLWAVRPRDPDPTARSLVLLDAQRARPYDGHGGRHRLGPSRSPNSYGRVLCLFRTPASCPPPRVRPKSALPFPWSPSSASHAGNKGSRGVNALWARHQWVGQGHSDGEYRALADTLRRGEISDVFFHVGPLDPDGSIPPGRYAHARALLAAMDRLAPGVRSQAYVGQVTSQGGGPLDLTRQAVRDRIVGTARTLLDLGFKGIHYDIEPVYPVDGEFLDLLERTHDLTRGRGGVLSVSLEQLELVNGMQTVAAAVLPDIHDPPRLSRSFLERVAGRVDQVAIMAYDTELPADWLVGRHFAWQAKHVTELVGDQVTVFIGVPTYAQGQPFPWAENLRSAIRGTRRGLDRLDRQPSHPVGLAIYADWTTTPDEWALYQAAWVQPGRDRR